jgi:hypothetical protein
VSGQTARGELPVRDGLLGARVPRLRALLEAPAWTITALLGSAYLIAAPASADLAAASYRSDLFGRAGFTVWDNGWYGGHHLPAYSVLAPALGWLVGPRLLATLSLILATALFAALIDGHFPRRATRLASAWFALGAAIALLSCRVPFDLGLTAGLGALVLAQRRRRGPALALALLGALASPVAGGFLALAGGAWWLSRGGGFAIWLAAAALAPVALLALAFPEGGFQPFVASAFFPTLAGVLLIAALIPAAQGRGARLLRNGALLYALALIGAYVLRTPVGGNVDRLGALAAGPLAACALLPGASGGFGSWRGRALAVLAPFLLYWQANAPVSDFLAADSDPAVHASYYAPLLGELDRLHVGYGATPARIEVVPTADHWEARFIAARVAIARGWERQLDNRRNALFYERAPLNAPRMRAWLSDEAISLVALSDAPLDYSGRAEAKLLRGGRQAFAREIWSSAHWRLFAVPGAALAQPPAVLTQLGSDSFTLRAPGAGTFTARVRYTPYWRLARGPGCVRRAGGDWTALQIPRAGSFHVVIDFSLARVVHHAARCS